MFGKRSFLETARCMIQLLARQGKQAWAAAIAMGEGKAHLIALALDGAGKVLDNVSGHLYNSRIKDIAGGGADATVVMMPGWQQRPSALIPFARFLAPRLYCDVRFPRTHPSGNIWSYNQMVDKNTLLLQQLAATGKPIVLVGYSRGGQNACDFARELISLGVEPSDICIATIATPWHGSPLAHLTFIPAGHQMVPGHGSLAEHRELLVELLKHGVDVLHFRFSLDAVAPAYTCAANAEVLPDTPCHYSIHLRRVQQRVAKALHQWLMNRLFKREAPLRTAGSATNKAAAK